ncbi:MAG TPA: MauE/DoxX family redox-associated membrane protein [Acidimicrobiales bacterium]|jgi:hypothetical protein|nr:MauE/DoxX family redox-associated membrane protein [Acidimicrobiales bacterium]
MTTPAETAPFLAACAVLAVAGAAKLYRPDDTARALAVAGLPHHRRLVRVGAVGEIAVAVAAVAAPGAVTGALVAAAYAAFTLFVGAALLRHWPLSSCGCFGRPDARPTYKHLALNVGALATALWWAVGAPAGVGALFAHSPWKGGPLVLVTLVISGLAYLVWTDPRPSLSR